MPSATGFKPVSAPTARRLILGTLPGAESIRQGQYYAHPRNAFWPIMAALIGAAPCTPYEKRLALLLKNGIALWDVCAAADREGSLDSAILSPVTNDFASFFAAHPKIEQILFNGRNAELLYLRHVLPALPPAVAGLPRIALPSTSPAHAAMRFEQKLASWRKALGET